MLQTLKQVFVNLGEELSLSPVIGDDHAAGNFFGVPLTVQISKSSNFLSQWGHWCPQG